MAWRVAALFLMASLAAGSSAQAQTGSNRGVGASVTWTAAGAGAGFGIGLWAGLRAFDDAINSDRKVWTSAAIGAAVGAVGGYFVARARRSRAQAPTPNLLAPPLLKLEQSFEHLTIGNGGLAGAASNARLQSPWR